MSSRYVDLADSPLAICRAQARKSPSDSFMMFALWIAVTVFRLSRLRELERELCDAPRGARGDHLDALDDAGRHLVLDPGVEVLGVLAHDDDVDAAERRLHPRERPDRPQVRVEVEVLPQRDVDAPVADARYSSRAAP